MSHRLRAGFLFESLLSFKEKKKTLYLLHSPLRTFNVPVNDVIVLKKNLKAVKELPFKGYV